MLPGKQCWQSLHGPHLRLRPLNQVRPKEAQKRRARSFGRCSYEDSGPGREGGSCTEGALWTGFCARHLPEPPGYSRSPLALVCRDPVSCSGHVQAGQGLLSDHPLLPVRRP